MAFHSASASWSSHIPLDRPSPCRKASGVVIECQAGGAVSSCRRRAPRSFLPSLELSSSGFRGRAGLSSSAGYGYAVDRNSSTALLHDSLDALRSSRPQRPHRFRRGTRSFAAAGDDRNAGDAASEWQDEGPSTSSTPAFTSREPSLLTQHSSLRRGATAAVLLAEENYVQAWKEFQRAEKRLLSTRQVASELNALPENPLGDQSVDIPVLPSVALPLTVDIPERILSDFRTPQGLEVSDSSPLVELAYDGGMWCIEACTSEPESPVGRTEEFALGSSASVQYALLDAEGAMSRSRSAVDTAARNLIARLHEEEDLQAQVIDRHIEAMDQGAQHQVARWLVEEMESLFSKTSTQEDAGLQLDDSASAASTSLRLAVPLDLDLAMQGYDEHAVRFLRHLPYDQVMKIRTIPPTPETKSLVALSAADNLERIISQPSGQPASDSPEQRTWKLPRMADPLEMDLVEGDVLPPVVGSSGAALMAGHDVSLGIDSSDFNPVEAKAGGGGKLAAKSRFGKYHSKVVLLGCCVCSLAAYMVANFELAVLAKDVAVILAAMSLALIAAQFVWRSGDSSESSEEDEDEDCYDVGAEPRALPGTVSGDVAAPAGNRGFIRGRSPSWDQVIWLLGAFAVVLSLSTMVALACKAAQAGLAALSTVACSFVLRVVPSGVAAAGFLPVRASAGVVRQVTTSLWLVLGGEMLSSGVESLGSAAAWAMLLLCVAFSIASAPVCIASSTSRRVHELLALARSRSPANAN